MKYKVSMLIRNSYGMISEKTLKRFNHEKEAICYCQEFNGSKKICITEWNGKRWINQKWFNKRNSIK